MLESGVNTWDVTAGLLTLNLLQRRLVLCLSLKASSMPHLDSLSRTWLALAFRREILEIFISLACRPPCHPTSASALGSFQIPGCLHEMRILHLELMRLDSL